jgi:hypothetical protein
VRRSRRGLGLVEILVGILCFLLAALPLVSLYGQNMENTRVLHNRTISLSAAREVLQQITLFPPHRLPNGEFVIEPERSTYVLNSTPPLPPLRLTALPNGFVRKMKIAPRPAGGALVIVSVFPDQTPRANVELSRTVLGYPGD